MYSRSEHLQGLDWIGLGDDGRSINPGSKFNKVIQYNAHRRAFSPTQDRNNPRKCPQSSSINQFIMKRRAEEKEKKKTTSINGNDNGNSHAPHHSQTVRGDQEAMKA